jgi:hypothetical protein
VDEAVGVPTLSHPTSNAELLAWNPQPDAIDLLASVDPIRIWRETIFDNWKDTGFEVDWARFSESAAKER